MSLLVLGRDQAQRQVLIRIFSFLSLFLTPKFVWYGTARSTRRLRLVGRFSRVRLALIRRLLLITMFRFSRWKVEEVILVARYGLGDDVLIEWFPLLS